VAHVDGSASCQVWWAHIGSLRPEHEGLIDLHQARRLRRMVRAEDRARLVVAAALARTVTGRELSRRPETGAVRSDLWCWATCRHRAREQARATSSGLSAVDVVERRVEIRVPICCADPSRLAQAARRTCPPAERRSAVRPRPSLPGTTTGAPTGGLLETGARDRSPAAPLNPASGFLR